MTPLHCLAAATSVAMAVATTASADFTPPITETVVYSPETELIVHSAPALSETAQEAWDTSFAVSSYYSAFAISKDGGYGFATTTNSPTAAREIAMMECLTHNAQCRVIAEVRPLGYVEPAETAATVTVEVAGYLQDLMREQAFRAAAISPDGAYSLVWGYGSLAEAENAAMTDCDGYRRPQVNPGDPTWPCVLLPLQPQK